MKDKKGELLVCSMCSSENINSVMQPDEWEYGAIEVGHVIIHLKATIPVRECLDCEFMWTDWEAEEIRDAISESAAKHLKRIET